MMKISSIAVYLGSAEGDDPKYMTTAREFGAEMARRGIRVVYGGADVGCMRALADGVLGEGGEIVGVFPEGFAGKKEVAERGIDIVRKDLTRMIWVKSFAERKQVMEDLCDCAVALPGGYGTMDELFTFALSVEIGRHAKPAFAISVDGYYDGLRDMLERMRGTSFLHEEFPAVSVCGSVEDFVDKII